MNEVRRTQGERSASTRQALVSASRDLFAADGFGAVSTEAIVRAAGVTRGAMYHHFADKAELFAAVFEVVESELAERIGTLVATSGETDPIAMMRLGAKAWLDACGEPAVQRIVLVDAPAVLGWARWREIGMRYGMGLVRGLLEHAMSVGRIAEQPVSPLAHVLIGAFDEATLYVALSGTPQLARREIDAVLDQLLNAIGHRADE